jgi:hypothetical protein
MTPLDRWLLTPWWTTTSIDPARRQEKDNGVLLLAQQCEPEGFLFLCRKALW